MPKPIKPSMRSVRTRSSSSSTDPVRIASHLTYSLRAGAGRADLFRRRLAEIARAFGMTRLAARTGLTREGLYKALAPDGNPSFDTVIRIATALGVVMTVESEKASPRWTSI